MSLIETRVKNAIDDAIRPIARQQEQLAERVEQLAKPRSGAGVSGESVMYGGPAIRSGEDSMSSRGYSLLRAMGFAAGIIPADQAKLEIAFHQRFRDRFEALQSQQRDSILCPLGSRLLRFADPGFAEEVQQTAAAGIEGYDLDEIRQMAPRGVMQALSWTDDTAGGAFVRNATQGELIELVRQKEIFSRAGARELVLDESGKFRLPRQTSATTAFWVGESTAITESEIATDTVDLQAKKLAILSRIPNELFRRTVNPSFEAIMREDFALTLSRKADEDMFSHAGSSTAVKGLLSYGITSIRATTQDADGDTLEPQDFGRLLAELEDADHDIDNNDSVAFVSRPRVVHDVLDRRADAVTANDAKGSFVFAANREDISRGAPARVRGYRLLTSTAVPVDREIIGGTSSSGSSLTLMLCGKFDEWIIARMPAVEIMLSPHAGTAFSQDESLLRGIMHIDAAPRHEDAFAMVDGLAEPS